jgi:tetratricopeptide (TPR) repeat protein
VGRIALVMLAGAIAGLAAGPGRASLYTPEETRFNVPVGADGRGQPIEFKEFKRRLATLKNAGDYRTKADGKVNSDRIAFLARIDRLKGKKLTPLETLAYASDLLRVGRPDDGRLNEALNRVQPLVRARNRDYLACTTMAHIHAARGEWREAVEYQDDATQNLEMPPEVKGLTKEQRDWIAKLDRDYVLPYYKIRLKESTAFPKHDPMAEDVYPLFPVAEPGKKHIPIRFVNDAGQYQPGVLSATERAKLPPDAPAIVQQLMFWYPGDTRLYWLLAELYAAEGDFASARRILDEAVDSSGQFGNRKILASHRTAIHAADDAKPRMASAEDAPLTSTVKTEESRPEPSEKISMRTIWIYFGAIALIAVFALLRAISRRAKGDCGPVG